MFVIFMNVTLDSRSGIDVEQAINVIWYCVSYNVEKNPGKQNVQTYVAKTERSKNKISKN